MSKVSQSKKNKNKQNESVLPVEDQKKLIEENDDPEGLAWPSVVAVVVANDPGVWFERSIESIANSGYPDLITLVLNIGENDSLKDRIAKIAPSVFIRDFDKSYNFASAINEAVDSIEGATYVLICHDDIVMSKGSINALVQEAFRSNASMVGPKILDGDNSDCILEVGGMIDRFGVPYTGIEKDEVDQGQHDGVRDVFYVSSATMLVRSDLFRALGGFDELCFPGAEDVDLSWRAHLVGARVLVQPEATITHHQVSESINTSRESKKSILAKHRMRAVLKNSSTISLMWILPVSFILHTIEGLFFLLRFDPKRSVLLFRGWLWNLRNIKQLRKTRKEIQSTRVVADRVISSHQIAGSARIRRFFHSVARSRQIKQFREASLETIRISDTRTLKTGPIYLGAFLVYCFSVRSLILGSIESVGSMVKWQSFSEQLSAIFHGGFPATDTPSFSSTLQRIVYIIFTTISGLNESIGQKIFIFSLIPIAVFGVLKLMKNFELSPRSIITATLSYGLLLLGLGLFEVGNLSVLITASALPYIIDGLINKRIRSIALGSAVLLAFNPSSLILLFAVLIVFIISNDKVIEAKQVLKASIYGIGIALFLNIGLVYDLISKIDRSSLGLTNVSKSFNDYFFPSKATLPIAIAIGVITVISLLVSQGLKIKIIKNLVSVTALLVIGSMFAISNGESTIDHFNIYALVALVFTLSIACCVNSFSFELTKKSLGIYHLLTVLSLLAVTAILVYQIPITLNGDLNMPKSSWGEQIDSKFKSRTIYIGSPKNLTGNPSMVAGNRGVVISQGPKITSDDSLIGPSSKLDSDFRRIYSLILDNETTNAGYLLNKMGIETIVVPTSLAPDAKLSDSDTQLLKALDRQIDLRRLQDRKGLVVYENQTFNTNFKKYQISQKINVDNLLVNTTKANNAKTYSSDLKPVNYSIVFVSFFSLITVFAWHRRKELIANAYSSVKKMQNIKGNEVESDSKKKIKDIDVLDLNVEEFLEDSTKKELKTKSEKTMR
jgi:GT2 family glycosyltransferase